MFFSDPDGNGWAVQHDRSRSSWGAFDPRPGGRRIDELALGPVPEDGAAVRPSPLLALIGALSATALSVAAPSADAAKRTITYSIANWGADGIDMARFARVVDATLNDPRGWSLGGTVRFERGSAGSFQVTIAAPSVVGGFGGCSAYYSCRSGHYVLINADRWAHATPAFPGERLRHTYRQMVVNHEVGHALGFGHAGCSGAGGLAPVMQQQSKGLQGCKANPWPLSRERSTLAGSLGVPVRAVPASLAIGRRAMWIELGATRRSVTAHLGAPATRQRVGAVVVDRYGLPPVTIAYRKGRVQAITTRSREDLTAGGVGVGVTVTRLRARLRGELCVPQDGAVRSCVVGLAERNGDRLTTFLVRDGRVSSVRVQRVYVAATPASRLVARFRKVGLPPPASYCADWSQCPA